MPDAGTEQHHTEAKNIAILTGGSIAITLVSQFTAAEVVTHMPRRSGTVAKYLLVLPIVLPPLILIEVWAYLLQPGSGLADVFLRSAGLPQLTWFSDPHLALASLLLIGFPWISNLGFLIFLGGLQNLPKDVLDASTIDGVGALKRVFTIDVPLLLPQFRIVVILSGLFAVQNFAPILLLTNGGPGTATLVPGLDMYLRWRRTGPGLGAVRPGHLWRAAEGPAAEHQALPGPAQPVRRLQHQLAVAVLQVDGPVHDLA